MKTKIKIPKGWRVMAQDELIKKGDRFYNTQEGVGRIGWNESLSIGFRPSHNHNSATYIRRTSSPHPKRAQAKRAKAVVLYAFVAKNGELLTPLHDKKILRGDKPFLVQPLSRASARFWNLGEEEKIEAMCKAGYEVQGVKRLAESWERASLETKANCREVCAAILNLIAPK